MPWSEGFTLEKDSHVEEFEQVLWPEDDDIDFGLVLISKNVSDSTCFRVNEFCVT